MKAIVKQDNIYVAVETERFDRTGKELESDESIVVARTDKGNDISCKTLFGGRVRIDDIYDDSLELKIDGFDIRKCDPDNYCFDCLSFEEVAAYLNQIEHLGVDAFLSNYKTQVQTLKNEVAGLLEKWEQQQAEHFDEINVDELNELRKFLLKLSMIVFNLLIGMNAGLENQDYINAYDNTVSHLSQYL